LNHYVWFTAGLRVIPNLFVRSQMKC